MLNLRVLQHNRFLHPRTRPNNRPGPDGHIGTELRRGVHLRRGVDEHRADDGGGGFRELRALSLERLLQVERVRGDSTPSRLDLSPEITCLVHEEPAGVGERAEDILLQSKDAGGVAIGGVEGGVARKTLRLRLHRGSNKREDAGGEKVHAAVDQVADMALGLLDVVADLLRRGVRDNAPELCGRVVADLCAQQHGLGFTLFEDFEHLLEREGAADVGVEHEHALGVAGEDGVAEVVETAGCAEGGVLAEVLESELREFGGPLLDEGGEDGLVVVANEDYFFDGGDLGDGDEGVVDEGVAGDFEEGLAEAESATGRIVWIVGARTLGRSRERGRKRVPLEGPPT